MLMSSFAGTLSKSCLAICFVVYSKGTDLSVQLTLTYSEYTDWALYLFKDMANSVSIRIRDEYLSKFIVRYHLHELFGTVVVQFVKYIVQKQQRFELLLCRQEAVLC